MVRARFRKLLLRSALAGSLALSAASTTFAQTNLSPGDVALIGWVDNGSPNDMYALVALADLPAGTILYFTDNGWDNVSGGFRNTNGPTDGNGNETLAMLTVNTAIPAGTILDTTQTASAAFTWTTSGSIPGATSGTFGSLVLTQSGDQVYVFQDDDGQNPLNVGTKVHLFVLDDTGTFEDATTTGEGNVPPGLSEAGHTALTFNQSGSTQNFMGFNTSALTHGTKDQWLSAIHDPANWTFGTSGALPTGSVVVDPPVVSSFCFGDGSSVHPCPCGNTGQAGHGCGNSANSAGAVLDATGGPNPDTLVLQASGMTPRTSALFQQNSGHLANDTTYGDGLRCTAGARLKLALRRTATGSARYPDTNDPSISARSAALGDPLQPGMVRFYSVVYRDPDTAFCPSPMGAAFNLTNVIRVSW
jgi:hypothetical protein